MELKNCDRYMTLDRFETTDGRAFVAIDEYSCRGCAFGDNSDECGSTPECGDTARTDGRRIIWVAKKESEPQAVPAAEYYMVLIQYPDSVTWESTENIYNDIDAADAAAKNPEYIGYNARVVKIEYTLRPVHEVRKTLL